jgi:hypothetical protein
VNSSERHQAALAKQMEANKVLDNDLKMMCVCTSRATLPAASYATCRYRKHKKDTADLEDKYKRDDYGRRYACASPCIYIPHITKCVTDRYCSYAISRLDRCEGLLQEWGTYVQSAAVTARAMDEVRSLTPEFSYILHTHSAASGRLRAQEERGVGHAHHGGGGPARSQPRLHEPGPRRAAAARAKRHRPGQVAVT